MRTQSSGEDAQLFRMGAARQRRERKHQRDIERLVRLHLDRAIQGLQEDFKIGMPEARDIIRKLAEKI